MCLQLTVSLYVYVCVLASLYRLFDGDMLRGLDLCLYRPVLDCCSKYFEPEALIADPVDGPIFASLLGKCLSSCGPTPDLYIGIRSELVLQFYLLAWNSISF